MKYGRLFSFTKSVRVSASTAVIRGVLVGIFLCANSNSKGDLSGGDNPSEKEALTGGSLSAEEVRQLETLVTNQPGNMAARGKILGYYFIRQFASRDAMLARNKHIFWIIKNRPDAEIAGRPIARIEAVADKEGYEEAKQLWLIQIQMRPRDAVIMGHAAEFFFVYDRPLSESLFRQAKTIQPDNPHWFDRLGQLYALEGGKITAAKALDEFEKAQNVDTSETARLCRLQELAVSAYTAEEIEKASTYARELLNGAERLRNDWSNYGNAVHYGNIVLGRIALKQGRKAEAIQYLIAAGKTPGSPQLNSFGPNMSLARELLEKGEKETVLVYYELCRLFWKGHDRILDKWRAETEKGQIPQFDRNLNR